MADPSDHDSVAGRAFDWLNSWKCVEWTTREVLDFAAPPADMNPASLAESIRFHYIETARGQRLGDSRMTLAGGGTTRTLGYCDGKDCYRVVFEPNEDQPSQVQAHRSFLNEAASPFVDRPQGFKVFYVGKTPLPEALKGVEPAGTSECLGRPATMFVFRDIPSMKVAQQLRYCLDDKTAVPLRVESFSDDAAMEAGRALWRWEATKFEPVQGHWMVLESVHKTFDRKDPRANRPTITRTFTTESIQFNKEYPASTFRPQVPKGVPVYPLNGGPPRTEGTLFHVKALGDLPKPVATVPVVAEPIRVTPETNDWGPWPVAALALGLVLLAGVALVRWRRR